MAEIPHTTIVTCRKCGAEKPVDGFRPNRRTCRECERVAARANYYAHPKEPGLIAAKLRQARANDPERYRLYDKKNAEKNKGAGSDYHKRRYARLDKEKANRLLAEWKNANPEKRRAMEARHRAKYPGKAAERMRRWVRDNPEAAAASRDRRRAREVGASGTFTKDDVRRLLADQGRVCFYCGTALNRFHVDHFIPLSRGGSNFPENLRLSCASCNCSKSAKMPWEWKPDRFQKP